MGQAKRMLEEIRARGWAPVEKNVCAGCVGDPVLAALITAAADAGECDYCGGPVAAPVDVILDAIVQGFRAEYEDPVNQAPWSSADGGYQVPTIDTWDLLQEHEAAEHEDLHADLSNAIDLLWCQRNPMDPAEHEALMWGWEGFRRHVTAERRYTFLLPTPGADDQRGWGEIPPEDMPAAVAASIADGGLARVLPTGAAFYRARVHGSAERPVSAKDLGSPPPDAARGNRMTAAGISAFYGASTAEGALAEVRGYMAPGDHATVARFETSRPLAVVDLVDLPDVPSLFDATRRGLRPAIRFLRGFAADVATPARPDDRQNLDYVPTQVVAEYLRYELAPPDGPAAGVLWRSSKDPAVIDCVLFVGNDDCVEQHPGWDDEDRPVLGLVPGSARHVPPV